MEVEFQDSKICYECVDDDYLSKEIKSKGRRRKCSYCQAVIRTYTLKEVTDRIEKVVLLNYERTPDQPSSLEYRLMADKESDYQWWREGQTISELLLDEFGITQKAAAQIEEELQSRYYDMDAATSGEETEFGGEVHYTTKAITDEHWSRKWFDFEQSLKSEARFFNNKAASILESIFQGLEKFKSWSGKSVLTKIGPEHNISSLFRARVFQSRDKLLQALCAPDRLLGAPASQFAMNGRMNARGVSVFYGATNNAIAIAEVRPPVGSKVAVARFELLRELQLLDLRELSNIREMVSVFDPEYLQKMEKAMFLRSLGEIMTKAIMPDDELFDYLATQAIADYLASQAEVQYDGIIYPSVQANNEHDVNIVLFHKAARVDPIILPNETDVYATDTEYEEEGEYESYQVIEIVRKKKQKKFDNNEKVENSERIPSLRVNLKSITVHKIKSVQYQYDDHPVSRHRIKQDKDFRGKLDLDF